METKPLYPDPRFLIGTLLGEGGGGKVFTLIGNQSNIEYAVKVQKKCGTLKKEAELLMKIDHKNIVKFIDYKENDSDCFLVMEKCQGISLYNRLLNYGKFPLQEVRKITLQLIDVLVYLHQKGIAHLDLKPENILLNNDTCVIKVIDFGFSTENVKTHQKYNGSFYYAAPELFFRNPYDPHKVDIWALGVIVNVMLSCKLPWPIIKDEAIHLIIKGKYQKLSIIVDSNDLYQLVEQCLVVDPNQRPTAEDLQKFVKPLFQSKSILGYLSTSRCPSRYLVNSRTNIRKPRKLVML